MTATVSRPRLYVLRATYLFAAIGLGAMIWPGILTHDLGWPHNRGVVHALLGAVGLLALFGLRHPLQMLPLLLFELVWKVIWLVAFALPLWSAGKVDAALRESTFDCGVGVAICAIAIPWRYFFDHYLRKPGDPWR